MRTGRPTDYDPAYCEMLIEHCKDGASIESFAAEIDVCRRTIQYWAKANPEFLLAVTKAKAKAKAWWEKTNRTLASTGTGNATACIFGMVNMSRQMDIEIEDPEWLSPNAKVELTGANGGPVVNVNVNGTAIDAADAYKQAINAVAR